MINDKIGKLISELDTAVGMLIMPAMENKIVREAKAKISQVSFELGNLIQDIETEKAIDNCRVRQMEMSDEGTGDDGGTCNLDATFLTLKGWREEKVLEAIKNAGLYCSGRTNWIGTGYILNVSGGNQGNDRTRVRDRFAEILRSKGYNVIHFDMMD